MILDQAISILLLNYATQYLALPSPCYSKGDSHSILMRIAIKSGKIEGKA